MHAKFAIKQAPMIKMDSKKLKADFKSIHLKNEKTSFQIFKKIWLDYKM